MKDIFRVFIVLLGVCILFQGCYLTLNPIYTDKELVYREELLGMWADKDNGHIWIFTKNDKKDGYELLYKEDEIANNFDAYLVKIGKYEYLDLYPSDTDLINLNEMSKMMLVRGHFFFRVTVEKDSFKVLDYDVKWVEKKLVSKEIQLQNYIDKDHFYIFSDSTESIQKAIISLEDKKEAFETSEQVYIKQK